MDENEHLVVRVLCLVDKGFVTRLCLRPLQILKRVLLLSIAPRQLFPLP
jgi:hypothetical protein